MKIRPDGIAQNSWLELGYRVRRPLRSMPTRKPANSNPSAATGSVATVSPPASASRTRRPAPPRGRLLLRDRVIARVAVGPVDVALDVLAHGDDDVGLIEEHPAGVLHEELLDPPAGVRPRLGVGRQHVLLDEPRHLRVLVVGVVAAA